MVLDNSKTYIQSWSGGKDSTASIVLEHMHRERLDIPPSKIVMAEVMFDNARGITGEYPDHMEWVYTKAKPLLESWGHEVVIKRSEKDYISLFRHVVQNSKKAERNGKKSGFPLGGHCVINGRCKMETIRAINRENEGAVHIVGIAADEKKRLARLNDKKISLLDMFGVTEEETYDIIKPFGLLSPSYAHTRRGGVLVLYESTIQGFRVA